MTTAPPADPPTPAGAWRPGSVPSTTELLWRASVNNATRPAHAGRVLARAVPQLGRLTRQIRRGTITPPPTTIPRTRWSGPVTAHRVFDAIRLELDDLRTIKQSVPGATINDVVLTIVGGGLRSYLLAKDELPADPLIAMAPISVRTEAERGAAGNMVSGMFTTLGTDVADPLERLTTVRESTHNSKEFTNALGARTLVDMADLMPGGLVGLGARTSARLSLANRLRPVFNTTVTNMPGPAAPAVHGRRRAGRDVRRRHDHRGHGSDPPGDELPRRHHDLVHVVPRDAARSGDLRRLPSRVVRGPRGRRGAVDRAAARTDHERPTPHGWRPPAPPRRRQGIGGRIGLSQA